VNAPGPSRRRVLLIEDAEDIVELVTSLFDDEGYAYTVATDGLRTPVVALTAHAMRGDRERALALGCDDYLSKPFEIDELLAVLERYTG